MKDKNKNNGMTTDELGHMVTQRFDAIDKKFDNIDKKVVTKADLKQFVTKRDLEKLAQSVARGFADVDHDFVYLRQEMRDSFSDINARLDEHMGDVREQTDGLANRVKKLEQEALS